MTCARTSGPALRARKGASLVALMVCALSFAAMAQPRVPPSDDDIARAVREALAADAAVGEVPVSVASHEGAVLLTGVVSNLLAKRWAQERALSVRGVRSVVNLIDVIPAQAKTEAMLREDIVEALALDPAVGQAEVAVDIDDQTAILSGRVDSWQEKQLVERVVAGVTGVREVRNRLHVQIDATRPDSEIQEEVRRALRWGAYVDEGAIEVRVDGGVVRLSGSVSRAIERQYALRAAWVAGVRSVDVSELRVDPAAESERERARKDRDVPDAQIEAALGDAFRYDPRVQAFRLEIDVANGIVTLSGAVDNIRAKRAAEQDAHGTVGVSFVNNQITVRPERVRTDAEIQRDVTAALGRRAYVDAADIEVTVQNGTVTLAGTVDSYWEKAQADDAVAGISGVVEVRNYLRVARSS